jgi:hypothetical protein
VYPEPQDCADSEAGGVGQQIQFEADLGRPGESVVRAAACGTLLLQWVSQAD